MRLSKAQTEALEEVVRRRKGNPRPADVVKAAEHPESPLHRLIGWHRDDDAVARAYRLERARLVLAALRLRESEQQQAEAGRAADARERARLASALAGLKERDARALINYGRGDGYVPVMREYADGGEQRILGRLLEGLDAFVRNQAALHAEFHAYMAKVAEEARRKFGPAEAREAA